MEQIGSSLLAVLIVAGCLIFSLFPAYQWAKHKGASQTHFLVGENTVDHELVAVLMNDGYGGVIARKVDPSTRQLLPSIFLFPQLKSIPVLRPMVVRR